MGDANKYNFAIPSYREDYMVANMCWYTVIQFDLQQLDVYVVDND